MVSQMGMKSLNTYGTDPLDDDSDDDGLNDGLEVELGTTDPLDSDSDGDGLLDGQDVEFVQDALSALPNTAFKNRGKRKLCKTAWTPLRTA